MINLMYLMISFHVIEYFKYYCNNSNGICLEYLCVDPTVSHATSAQLKILPSAFYFVSGLIQRTYLCVICKLP